MKEEPHDRRTIVFTPELLHSFTPETPTDMRKILFRALLIMTVMMALPAQAQIKLGVKSGINLSDVQFKQDDLKAENRLGFFVGPVIKFHLPVTGLSVDAAALYDQREAKVEGTTMKAKSVLVPVNVRITAGSENVFTIFAFGGPQFAFNLSDDLTLKENYQQWKWKEATFSLNVGLGMTFGRHLEIYGNYNVACSRTADAIFESLKEGTARANAWQIGLALYL